MKKKNKGKDTAGWFGDRMKVDRSLRRFYADLTTPGVGDRIFNFSVVLLSDTRGPLFNETKTAS